MSTPGSTTQVEKLPSKQERAVPDRACDKYDRGEDCERNEIYGTGFFTHHVPDLCSGLRRTLPLGDRSIPQQERYPRLCAVADDQGGTVPTGSPLGQRDPHHPRPASPAKRARQWYILQMADSVAGVTS